MKLQGEEAQIKHVDEEGSYGVYHMLRILKVILEGHPSSMLPYPSAPVPAHRSPYFEGLESRRS